MSDGFVAAGAGVVDEEIDAAEGALGLADQTSDIVGAADVAGDGNDLDAVLLGDCFRACCEVSLVARGEHHADAFCREAVRNGETDSVAAPGDERDFAIESEIHGMGTCLARVAPSSAAESSLAIR